MGLIAYNNWYRYNYYITKNLNDNKSLIHDDILRHGNIYFGRLVETMSQKKLYILKIRSTFL